MKSNNLLPSKALDLTTITNPVIASFHLLKNSKLIKPFPTIGDAVDYVAALHFEVKIIIVKEWYPYHVIRKWIHGKDWQDVYSHIGDLCVQYAEDHSFHTEVNVSAMGWVLDYDPHPSAQDYKWGILKEPKCTERNFIRLVPFIKEDEKGKRICYLPCRYKY